MVTSNITPQQHLVTARASGLEMSLTTFPNGHATMATTKDGTAYNSQTQGDLREGLMIAGDAMKKFLERMGYRSEEIGQYELKFTEIIRE